MRKNLPAGTPGHLSPAHVIWCHSPTPGKTQKTSSQTSARFLLHRPLKNRNRLINHLFISLIISLLFTFATQTKHLQPLTQNFTCSRNKIVGFSIFVYDSNKELTLNVELSLPPANRKNTFKEEQPPALVLFTF